MIPPQISTFRVEGRWPGEGGWERGWGLMDCGASLGHCHVKVCRANVKVQSCSIESKSVCCCLDKDELESTLRIMDERADHGEVHERASRVWQA